LWGRELFSVIGRYRMRDITKKFYNTGNDLFGYPQVYKDVKFYPLKIMDTEGKHLYYRIFQYPKEYIPDKAIIKSSYLKYLLVYINSQLSKGLGESLEKLLIKFLKIVTKVDDIQLLYPEKVSTLEELIITVKIGNVKFNEGDFEIIREIILNQNGLSVEYVEEFNPELEELLSFMNRKFDNLSFEDEVITFCSMLGKTIQEIEDYTLYQFSKHFERLILLHTHTIYSPLEISGQIKSKDGSEIIKHYLSPVLKNGRYSSIMSSMDDHPELKDGFKLTK